MSNNFGMKYEIGDNTFFAIDGLISAAKSCEEIAQFDADGQEDDVNMARAAIIHAIASIAIADYVDSQKYAKKSASDAKGDK